MALLKALHTTNVILLLLAASTSLAWADEAPPGRDAAAAEVLFEDGKRLLEQNRFAEACPKLAESFRLDPATGALLTVAMCHDAAGETATAWAEYSEVAVRARREGRRDREAAALAGKRALEPKLSRLTVTIPDAVARVEGVEVRRDRILLGPASWSTAVPVNPGTHVIDVSAPGKMPWRYTTRSLVESDQEVVTVPLLVDEPRLASRSPKRSPPTNIADERATVTGATATGALSTVARPAFAVHLVAFGGVTVERPAAVAGVALTADRFGWRLGVDGAWIAGDETESVVGGQVRMGRSFGLRAHVARALEMGRRFAFAVGPEVSVVIDRAQATGVAGGFPAQSRATAGVGVHAAMEFRPVRRVLIALRGGADYAPTMWGGSFEIEHRGAVLEPSPFRLMVVLGTGVVFE